MIKFEEATSIGQSHYVITTQISTMKILLIAPMIRDTSASLIDGDAVRRG
jgi:hypothetical protein